jgi:hypothetical protein
MSNEAIYIEQNRALCSTFEEIIKRQIEDKQIISRDRKPYFKGLFLDNQIPVEVTFVGSYDLTQELSRKFGVQEDLPRVTSRAIRAHNISFSRYKNMTSSRDSNTIDVVARNKGAVQRKQYLGRVKSIDGDIAYVSMRDESEQENFDGTILVNRLKEENIDVDDYFSFQIYDQENCFYTILKKQEARGVNKLELDKFRRELDLI